MKTAALPSQSVSLLPETMAIIERESPTTAASIRSQEEGTGSAMALTELPFVLET